MLFAAAACTSADAAAVADATARVLLPASSADPTHEKLALRSAARATPVAAHAAARGSPLPAPVAAALTAFVLRCLAACTQYDGVTCAAVGAAAALLLPLVPQDAATPVAQAGLAAADAAARGAVRGWAWATLLLPWAAAAVSNPHLALTLAGSAEQQLLLLGLWLSADAAYDAALRPVSTAAALSLLQSLPPDALGAAVAVAPVRAHWEQARLAAATKVPLRNALLVAVLRLLDPPPLRVAETFLAHSPAAARVAALPLPCSTAEVEAGAKAVFSALPR